MGLLSQVDFGGALAALVIGRFGDGDNVRMFAEELAEGAAEDAHAGAMDDADVGQSSEEGLVEEAGDLVFGFVGGTANDVDLRGQVVGVGVGPNGDASAFAGSFKRGDRLYVFHFGDVGNGNAHLHRADRDFEVPGVDQALDAGLATEALELDQGADFNALGEMRLGSGIVPVGPGVMSYYRGIELV